MKFIAMLSIISLVAFPAFGQTPPTATEAFKPSDQMQTDGG